MAQLAVGLVGRNEAIVGKLLMLSMCGALTYLTFRWIDTIDPTRKRKVEAQKRAEKLMCQAGVEKIKLSDYEMIIASLLVDPLRIHIAWDDIAGLDEVLTELQNTVVLPVQKKHLFEGSKLLKPPKGVLLYGPPGCGKTLIAKATAKEAGFRFINLQPSTLMDKWYGESEKLATAVFTLAFKIQPVIIFIDEIDSFLRNRSITDQESTAAIKALFMSLWDGLDTDEDQQVIIMGATNRPQDIDAAILRRMPSRFHIKQPGRMQREQILKVILNDERVDLSVNLCDVSRETEGFSGSDLKEMCREAALLCLRDFVEPPNEQPVDEETPNEDGSEHSIRPIQQSDLRKAITKMRANKTFH